MVSEARSSAPIALRNSTCRSAARTGSGSGPETAAGTADSEEAGAARAEGAVPVEELLESELHAVRTHPRPRSLVFGAKHAN